MNFLGSVNIFHGRVTGGRLSLAAGLEADAPAHVSGEDRNVVAFVRPHDIDVDLSQKNGPSARARVKWIHPIGAVVKVELELLDDKKEVQVELTRDRYETLRLSVGEIVYVTPKGLKVFVGTYSI